MKSRSPILFLIFTVLLFSGLVTTYLSFQSTSPETIVSNLEKNLEDEVGKVEREAQRIIKNINAGSSIDLTFNSDNYFLLYENSRLIFWTDNNFVPTVQAVSDTFNLKLLKTSGSDYLIKKWVIRKNKFLISIIQLHKEYKIKNNYLVPEWNKKIFGAGNTIIHEAGSGKGLPIYLENQNVFNVSLLESLQYHQVARWIAAGLFFIALIFFVLFLYSVLDVIKKRSIEFGFVFLALCLILVRLLMILINFPNGLVHTELFNPQNFASSSYNGSLGDMLLNELVLIALCFYLFKNYAHFKILRYVIRNKIARIVLSAIAMLCVLFSWLYPFIIIQTLYNNSSISLDISQSLQFDLLRIVAYVSILLSWVTAFLFSHVFIRLMIPRKNWLGSLAAMTIGILIFVLINTYTEQPYISSLICGLFYFMVVYFLKLYSSLRRLSYATFVYMFITVFCFSVNGAYGINYFNKKERIETQFHFASNFLIDRDYFGEYLLEEVSLKVTKDAFIQMRMRSPFFTKDIIRQKIRQIFLPSYFNKYDVDILLFNSIGTPYNNRAPVTFSEFINLYTNEAFRTAYKDVYFINSPSADVTHKYLVVVPVKRMQATAGYVVIELSLKKIIPESVYPELLVGNSFQQFYKTQDLSYAVFANKNIVFSSGNFNYEDMLRHKLLGDARLYNGGLEDSGYLHIAQEDELGRAAVVSSKTPSSFFVVSNFSFFLVLGLAVILLLILFEGMFSYLRGSKLFFSTRIQLFLNIAFFLPLIIVSATTLGLTSRSSKELLDAAYLSNSKSVGAQIASSLDEYLQYANENQIDFENQLTNLTKLINLDANIYNPKGSLIATSQPLIFENDLVSTFINPSVLKKIGQGENLFIETERVGKLEYFVSYATLKSPVSGKFIGILGIPFFQSVQSLEKMQTTIFTNILNIFAAIFIVLLLLSYFVSEWLTFPLKFITQTLKRTSLIKTNQPLTWRADDEIGLMVKEYNQMLYKLSESKAELEQTQREMAWREIAQQVAHEIKNPLTPMKLTLQQMQRSIQNGISSTEKTEKAVASLLAQIDTLSDIASSFSSFAKMPEPVIQNIDLVLLLKRIVSLHMQSCEINFRTLYKELFVCADEKLLGRTFSNLILNSIQAAKPGVHLIIDISLEKKDSKCITMVRDNGNGIADTIAERVFVPHFSTKKSGSGLGLAIAKQGIEQMGGKVWFETKVGSGTVFYIELPLS